jgi:uncharacterized protein YheU (UPF0270 family)
MSAAGCYMLAMSSEDYVEVPASALSPEALEALVDDFTSREGTDYGEREYSLADKRAHVLAGIARGEVVIVFDPKSETATLVTRRELRGR